MDRIIREAIEIELQSQQHKQGEWLLPDQVMEASHSRPEWTQTVCHQEHDSLWWALKRAVTSLPSLLPALHQPGISVTCLKVWPTDGLLQIGTILRSHFTDRFTNI